MNRRVVAAGAGLAALVVLVPVAAVAAVGERGGPVNRQALTFRTHPVSTDSTSFRRLRAISPQTCSRGAVSVTVSMKLVRGPVDLRVLSDGVAEGQGIFRPGVVRFGPGASSFTFVGSVAPFEAEDGHSFDVQWRSPTGERVTSRKATVVAQYRDPGTC
jgi:hypothetical protein